MDVSVVMPLYKARPELIRKIESALKGQKFKGKMEIMKIEGLGLADALNHGIRKARYKIVISLHQDCVPEDSRWIEKLTKPLEDERIVCSVSNVYLPRELWESFDWASKILSAKEQELITPLMDEKGVAYKKEALLKAGLFDGKTYRTAGEDFDMYLKLKKVGQIAYPGAKVIHHHHYQWKSRLKKELQLSEAFGALVRNYGTKMPSWHIGLIKSIPLLGYPLFLLGMRPSKIGWLSIPAIPLMLAVNIIYSYGFWKGFVAGKQKL